MTLNVPPGRHGNAVQDPDPGRICLPVAFLAGSHNGPSTALGEDAIVSNGQIGPSWANMASEIRVNRSGMTTEEGTAGC